MGWASGSSLMSDIIKNVKKIEKDPAKRMAIYKALIGPFEDADCDTLYECERDDKAFRAALRELNPEHED